MQNKMQATTESRAGSRKPPGGDTKRKARRHPTAAFRRAGGSLAWKILGILVLMVVSGMATVFVGGIILMNTGLRLHADYEYYQLGEYWALYFRPAATVFLVPGVVAGVVTGVVVWYLHKRGTRKERSG